MLMFQMFQGNVSKDFAICNMKKKTGLKGVLNILDIHKYLMKRNDIK